MHPELWISSLIVFAIAQIINVIVSTFKYILTAKASPAVASIVNALSYTIGNLVTLILVKQDPTAAIIVTFLSNLIGVPVGRWLVDKFSKDKLFIFNATIRCTKDSATKLRADLKDLHDIHSTFVEVAEDKLYDFKIFSNSKKDSITIEEYLNKYDSKFHKIESR